MKLNHYKIHCSTDAKWEHWWLAEDEAEPTTCPTDTAHAVTAGSAVIIAEKADGRVTAKIEEEKPGLETGGNYAAETIAWDAAPGVTTKSVTLLLPVAMLTAALETRGLNDGDEVGLDLGPNTTVGVLAADVAAAATTIPMPATMKAAFEAGALWLGMVVHLNDGTNNDCLGVMQSVDLDADTFECSVATANAFLAATPTLVNVTATMSPGILGAGTDNHGWVEIKANGGVEEFGNAKIGGTRIDAGKVIQCRYNNKSEANVRVVIRLEFLY